MRTWSIIALSTLACGGFFAGAAFAEVAKTDAANAPTPCFEVEVNGERAPSYDCLTQKLRPAAGAAGPAATPGMGSEAIVLRPSNQLGLFNRAATANRMGNTFGTSVYPQRPPGSPAMTPRVP